MEKNKKNKQAWILTPLLVLIIISILALTYHGWRYQQELESRLHQFDELILNQQEKISKIPNLEPLVNQQAQQIEQLSINIQKMKKPKNQIEDIRWLIQQAEWQINLFFHPKLSQHLLTIAQKIAETENWSSLNQSLENDINQLNQLDLTPASKVIKACAQVKQQLAQLSPKRPSEITKEDRPSYPKYIEIFKPYFQIDHYETRTPKIPNPIQQGILIDNLKLLLPQIQLAALNQDNSSYHQLLSQFKDNLQDLNELEHHAELVENITKMEKFNFTLSQPIHFQSANLANELEKQYSERANS
jgi:hypothetical protein